MTEHIDTNGLDDLASLLDRPSVEGSSLRLRRPTRSMQQEPGPMSNHLLPVRIDAEAEREKYLSLKPQNWEFFHASELFGEQSVAMVSNHFAGLVQDLEGRRRPLDTMFRQKTLHSLNSRLGKVIDALESKGIRTISDLLSLTQQRFEDLQGIRNVDAVISSVQEYLRTASILPHVQLLADISQTKPHAVPKEEEARIIGVVELAMTSLRRIKSPLIADRVISYYGLRDGVKRSIAQVAAEYGVSTKSISNDVKESQSILAISPFLERAHVLPWESLGRLVGATLLSDLPNSQDVSFNLQAPIFQSIRYQLSELGITSFDALMSFDFAEKGPLSPEDIAKVKDYMKSILPGTDPLGVQRRLAQVKELSRLSLALQGIVQGDENRLIPGRLTAQELARIRRFPMGAVVRNAKVHHMLRINLPEDFPEEDPSEKIPALEAFLSGEAERAILRKRISIGQLLRKQRADLVQIRLIKHESVNQIVSEIIALASEVTPEVQGDFSFATSLEEYLKGKKAMFFADPAQPREVYEQILAAEDSLARQNVELASSLIRDDILLLSTTSEKYQRLFAHAPEREKYEDLKQNIQVLTQTYQEVIKPSEETLTAAQRMQVEKYHEYVGKLIEESKGPELAKAAGYDRRVILAQQGIVHLQQLLQTIS